MEFRFLYHIWTIKYVSVLGIMERLEGAKVAAFPALPFQPVFTPWWLCLILYESPQLLMSFSALIPQTPCVELHGYNPSTWAEEAGKWGVRSHSQLLNLRLNCVAWDPVFKKQKTTVSPQSPIFWGFWVNRWLCKHEDLVWSLSAHVKAKHNCECWNSNTGWAATGRSLGLTGHPFS